MWVGRVWESWVRTMEFCVLEKLVCFRMNNIVLSLSHVVSSEIFLLLVAF